MSAPCASELSHSCPRPEHPPEANASQDSLSLVWSRVRHSSTVSYIVLILKAHNVNAHYTLDIVTSLRVVDTCAIHRALSESFQQSVQLSPAYGPGPTTIALSIHYHCVRPSIHFSHSSPPLPPSPPPRPLELLTLSCSMQLLDLDFSLSRYLYPR